MVIAKKQPKRARKQTKRAPTKTILRKKEALQSEKEEVSNVAEVNPTPQLETTIIENGTDRMLRYRRNPQCPKCGAHPVICTIRRISYRAFRCRMCGHRWEFFNAK